MKMRIISSFLALAGASLAALPAAQASETEKKFFSSVEGKWSGPGEIVAGKYKGTKFTCNFIGATPDGKLGMSLDGACRVGMFTQKMSAKVERSGRTGYSGSFLDGAAGKGLDVVGGKVDKSRVTLALVRNELKGAMLARMHDENTMNVTVSVRVDEELVPVIGMNLKRMDGGAIGAISQN
jgi:hypothetical protein